MPRESRVYGFEIAGRRGRTYSETGLANLTGRAKSIIARNLGPEQTRLRDTRKKISDFNVMWKSTKSKSHKAAIFAQIKIAREEAVKAEVNYLKKYFFLLLHFPRVIPIESKWLSRLKGLIIGLGEQKINQQIRNFRGFIRSKEFRQQRLALKQHVKWDYDYEDHQERLAREFSFMKKRKTELERTIVHLLERYAGDRTEEATKGNLGRVPKKYVSEYANIITQALDNQAGYISANISFLNFLIVSSKQANLSKKFVSRLVSFHGRAMEIGAELASERDFWIKLPKQT